MKKSASSSSPLSPETSGLGALAGALGQQQKSSSFTCSSTCCDGLEEQSSAKPRDFYGTLGFLFAIVVIEGADIQLLPATFRALEANLSLSPLDLATLGLCQALTQSCSAPFWGSLADHGYQRKRMLALGAFSWGLITATLAFTTSFPMMLALRACNGCALGTMMPITQSLIVDLTKPSERGFYFGCGCCSFCFGVIVCSVFAASLSNQDINGVPGWRVAFLVVAFLSLIFSFLLFVFMPEPRRSGTYDRAPMTVSGEVKRFQSFWRISTFKLIVIQGVFGAIPSSALTFLLMYFQYIGMSDFQSSVLFAIYILSTGMGAILGGIIGDRLSIWSPNHGRPLAAQISIASGLPLVVTLLSWVFPSPDNYDIFAVVLFCMGLLSSWCSAAAKMPILAELVADKGGRASILALDCAVQGASAAIFGAPLVGVFAETMFHYQKNTQQVAEMPEDQRLANAAALSSAMLCCTVVPWCASLTVFTMLHSTYGPDVSAAKAESALQQSHPSGSSCASATTSLI